jgi:PAS domain S-box-containing protein
VEDLIGKNVSDQPLYRNHLARNREGNALLTAQQDGIERIYGYVQLTDFPLIAVAALGKEDMLQPWRSDTFINTIAVTGLVLLLQFLGFRLVRQTRLQAKTESALVASEFRWKNALESTGDIVWDLEHQSGAVQMSKEWTLLMGHPSNTAGRSIDKFKDLVHPDDRPATIEKFERYLRGETTEFVNTQRVQTRDGQWKWLLTRGMVVARDANGQPLRTLGTHTDISEQKAQEEKLRTARDVLGMRVDQRTRELRHNNALLLNEITERRRAEQALQESELRWKFALEGAGDGIWDWDIPGRLLHTSRRWRDMARAYPSGRCRACQPHGARCSQGPHSGLPRGTAATRQERRLDLGAGPRHHRQPRCAWQTAAHDRHNHRYHRTQGSGAGAEPDQSCTEDAGPLQRGAAALFRRSHTAAAGVRCHPRGRRLPDGMGRTG